MVCPIQNNTVPFKIIVLITLGVNKQHNFTSLLKHLNALANIGSHTGGNSLLESYTTAFNGIMLGNNGDLNSRRYYSVERSKSWPKKIYRNVHGSVHFTAKTAKFIAV